MNSFGGMFRKYVLVALEMASFLVTFCLLLIFLEFDGPRSSVQSAIPSNRFSTLQFRLTFVSFCVLILFWSSSMILCRTFCFMF